VAIKTRVDGQILTLRIKEGQLVHQGDVLVEIDPQPFQAALAQATARKAQDEANLENARRTLQRDTPLAKQSVITQQQRDTDAANAAQLSAAVQADQAAIVSAETQLGYATIHAPITGVAGFLEVTVGNIVHATDQTPIVTITQLQPISVIFTAPEEELPDIQAGLKAGALNVAALASAGGQQLAEGTLSIVNNQVDPASGTIQLKASFDNKDNALWPGLSVVTRLEVKTLKAVTVVPEDAVQHGPNGYFAYVVDKASKAQSRDIGVSRTGNGLAVIDKGIAPGDQVVTAGQSRLQPGVLVAANQGNGPPGANPGSNAKVAANQPPGRPAGQAGGAGE
jgi:membrane fusion protein, multidrug efflux system